MQVKFHNTGNTATTFTIISDPARDAEYRRLREVASKFSNRNRSAALIDDLLFKFRRSVIAPLQATGLQMWELQGKEFDVDASFDLLDQAAAIDVAAKSSAQPMKTCGVGGCQNRIPANAKMCARCAHDEE